MRSTIYEIRVDGCLQEHNREAFYGLQLEEVPVGLVLRGTVIDESHLLGIVSELRVLGLRLVSVRPLGRGNRAAPWSTSRSQTVTWSRHLARRLRRRER